MSSDLLRIVLSMVIAAHGIGHIIFLMSVLGLADWGHTGRSWLLSDRLPDGVVKGLGGLIWLIALVGFMAAGVGLFAQFEWWRGLAVASSVVSLLGLVLFAQSSQPFWSAGVMDVAILVALLVFHWPGC